MNLLQGLLLINSAATWYMVGLIWVVQVVHYPLFALVPAEAFQPYHSAHLTRISLVVILPMLIELLTALILAAVPPVGVPSGLALLGAALVLLVWALTFLVQSPQHGLLQAGFSREVIAALVSGNWWRTLVWTLRGGLTIWMLGFVLAR